LISHKLRSKDARGWFIEGKKKWIFPGSTHSVHLHISGRPRRTSPFFFSFHVSPLFVCFFFSFLWSIVYTHIEFETLFFFLFFLITPNNTYLYIICTLFKGHNISIVFFFFLYLAPSVGKQTRLVIRTKSSWFSHTRRAYSWGNFNAYRYFYIG